VTPDTLRIKAVELVACDVEDAVQQIVCRFGAIMLFDVIDLENGRFLVRFG